MAIQLQEFAKQVLFGATLEEKLSFPREPIVDTRPGDPIDAPRHLTRPAHLQLREDGVRADHPSRAKLHDEAERGRLLHFFGNHELLATELMALALLKFPDAPKSFRQGLLETLKDEQIHTRIYIHRMQQCGIAFGELPLSDYFWKSVSSMGDPLDYVTRLSLTFEQANLDYSREYGALFRQLGDTATAAILEKIYRDEIGHVGFGLRWFRQWKANGKSDWEAFRERLVFPLSPSRAKGNRFNAEGRSAAGLDAAFIKSLQLFNQSRGRTPTVFWFNPQAERFAAANEAKELDWATSPLERDLAFLPCALCRQGDILVVPEDPPAAFLRKLQDCGLTLPELAVAKNASQAPELDRKLGDIRPWAWTPDSLAYFKQTRQRLTRPQPADTLWNPRIRELYAKPWAADFARDFTEANADAQDWLAPAEVYGKPVASLQELEARRSELARLGYPHIACKLPFGTAANGNRVLKRNEAIEGPLRDWLDKGFAGQQRILVEPWLDRVFDFSVQFERANETLRMLGVTRLLNNARGQFQGILVNAFTKGLDPNVLRLLMQPQDKQPRLFRLYEKRLAPALDPALASIGFHGPLGIDAFVYRDPTGALRLKPVVEINPRLTMGRIALELSSRNAPGTVGLFQIHSKPQLKKFGFSRFADYSEALEREAPIAIARREKPFIRSGSLPLADPKAVSHFLPVYHVRERFEQLPLAPNGRDDDASAI